MPEDVAYALLTYDNRSGPPVQKAVARNKVAVEKPAPDEPGGGVLHLAKSVRVADVVLAHKFNVNVPL